MPTPTRTKQNLRGYPGGFQFDSSQSWIKPASLTPTVACGSPISIFENVFRVHLSNLLAGFRASKAENCQENTCVKYIPLAWTNSCRHLRVVGLSQQHFSVVDHFRDCLHLPSHRALRSHPLISASLGLAIHWHEEGGRNVMERLQEEPLHQHHRSLHQNPRECMASRQKPQRVQCGICIIETFVGFDVSRRKTLIKRIR